MLNAPFPGIDSSTASIVGSFVLDTTVAAQSNGGAPLLNAAEFPGAVQSLSVSIPNNTWTASSADLFVHHQFLGVNEDTYFIDTKTISGPALTGADGKPYSPSEIGIELIQNGGTLFSDASILPIVTLSDFDSTIFFFEFTNSSSGLQPMQAFLTSFAPTPLPSALPLFATGVGAIGLLGWRRKRKAQAAA